VQDLLTHLLVGGWLQQIETTRFRPVIQIGDTGRVLLQSAVDSRVIETLPAPLVAAIAAQLTDADEARTVAASTVAKPG
jgi:hypothetical protein